MRSSVYVRMARSGVPPGIATDSRRAESVTPSWLTRRLSTVTAVMPWSSRTSSTRGSCRLSGASVSAPGTGTSTCGALSATSRIGSRTVSALSGAPPAVARASWYSPEEDGTKLPAKRASR